MSLHVSYEIHPFFLLYLTCGFGTDLRRAANMPYPLVGSDVGRSGSFLSPEKYLACSLSGALRRQTNTMQ